MKTRRSSIFLARSFSAVIFDTEEEKKKYQQEHEVRPETKLEVKPEKTENQTSVLNLVKPESQGSVQRPEYNRRDYGSWISPEGEIHRVTGFQQHVPILSEIFKQKKIKGKIKNYADAFKHGYIRVNNDPLSIQVRGSLTLKQKYALVDLAEQYAEKTDSTTISLDVNMHNRLFTRDDDGSFREWSGGHAKVEDAIRNASMVSIDTVPNQHSMTPNDTWIEVDGGKPTGNSNEFPLDDTADAQKEIIREVNMNRNDVTSLAASELVRVAKSLTAGGTVFYLKSPLDNYRAYVERMMPKWYASCGEYSGEYLKGSLKWGKAENEGYMLATSHHFTFQHTLNGEIFDESGKITARNDGNQFYVAVLLNH